MERMTSRDEDCVLVNGHALGYATITLEATKMPDEYISRAKALEDFEACNAGNPRWTPQRVKTLLLRQPAADVAPVVRCRDCKHRTEYGNCGHPRQKGVLPSAYPYDFCSYGDRRVDHLALEAETTQIIDGCCTACGAFMDCCEAAEYKFCPYCAKRIV